MLKLIFQASDVKVYMNEAKRVRLKDGDDLTAFKLIVIKSTLLLFQFFRNAFCRKIELIE